MERSPHLDNDLTVSIAGLERGSRPISSAISASDLQDLAPEFRDTIELDGEIRRVGQRFYVHANVSATATMICDRSLKEFMEPIERSIDLVYELDADLARSQRGTDLADVDIRGLDPDARQIDLADDVRQELALGLPMKRIAPQYREKELEEIYPELRQSEDTTDDRWEALNKLRGNQT